jgi:hypothetical protein
VQRGSSTLGQVGAISIDVWAENGLAITTVWMTMSST